MKKKVHIFMVIAALVLGASLFAGCTNSVEEEEEDFAFAGTTWENTTSVESLKDVTFNADGAGTLGDTDITYTVKGYVATLYASSTKLATFTVASSGKKATLTQGDTSHTYTIKE